jgi:hypothetical protein
LGRRLEPFARVSDAGIGADGVDDGFGGGRDRLGLLDDQPESEAEIAAAAREQTKNAGVAVEGGASRQMEFASDIGNFAPFEEGFLDGVAFGMAADAALAAVLRDVDVLRGACGTSVTPASLWTKCSRARKSQCWVASNPFQRRIGAAPFPGHCLL